MPSLRGGIRRLMLLLSATVLFLVACGDSRVPALDRETLFSLEYGKMEDEVELFLDSGTVDRKTRLATRGGLVYVASGHGGRIMEFTSFGDLVTLYYNPDQNPRPIMLETANASGVQANRLAVEYPFNVVGEVAVMSDGTLLIEDQVPDRIAVIDDDLGVRLNRVVVRLDKSGTQSDYLGQEAIGGSFFPYIQSIDVTSRDDIVVTTAAPPKNIVFWYDSEGTLLRRIEIGPEHLPIPEEIDALPVLESVVPDHDLRRLYLKVNYYITDEEMVTGQWNDRTLSRIYWISIEDGSYEGFVDVPENRNRDSLLEAFGESEVFSYELLGAAPGEHLFLLSQETSTQSQLMILNTSGRVVRRRTIELDYDEVVIRDLHVSAEGILGGLLALRDRVEIVWWRTDRLFGE